LKSCAKEVNPEAYWRSSACYLQGIGVNPNKYSSRLHSLIAIDYDKAEGYFWYGKSFSNLSKGCKYFEAASSRQLATGHFFFRFCLYHGYGIKTCQKEGIRLMILSGPSGDQYWSRKLSLLFQIKESRSRADSVDCRRFATIALQSSNSDCSIFDLFFCLNEGKQNFFSLT
jgi:hypothetical protein